jgi:hypothetical protein
MTGGDDRTVTVLDSLEAIRVDGVVWGTISRAVGIAILTKYDWNTESEVAVVISWVSRTLSHP